MPSDEHDNPANEGTQPGEHVNGAASPANGEKPKTDSGALGNGDYDEYATSGANPFSSAYPHETGTFRRLAPREFPEDETPASLPMMEQLPDPNALPDPGYPVMTGYEAFPPVASAFPPAAEPETQAPDEAAEHPSWSSGSSWPSAPSAPAWEEQASLSRAYEQSPDPAAGPDREGSSTLDPLRHVVAERMELPLDRIDPRARPLDELHLSSTTVSQIAVETARRRGKDALPPATNLATVTLAEGEIRKLHVGLKGTMNALFLKDLAQNCLIADTEVGTRRAEAVPSLPDHFAIASLLTQR